MPPKSLNTKDMADSSDEFEAIYESNAPLIFRFMFWRTNDRMLAEDLTSNVFEKAWRSRQSFKGGSARAWLHMIARNTLIDYWRRQRDLLIDESALAELEDEKIALGPALDQEILVKNLQRAVSRLPDDMRQVVELRFIEGLSARQTGQKLGFSEVNIRVIQYRALRKLKDYLK